MCEGPRHPVVNLNVKIPVQTYNNAISMRPALYKFLTLDFLNLIEWLLHAHICG